MTLSFDTQSEFATKLVEEVKDEAIEPFEFA